MGPLGGQLGLAEPPGGERQHRLVHEAHVLEHQESTALRHHPVLFEHLGGLGESADLDEPTAHVAGRVDGAPVVADLQGNIAELDARLEQPHRV